MSYFQTFKINNHIYQIKDAMGVLSTLIVGKDFALLIDTGYGLYNLKQYIETITKVPLIVVNSHGHMDHSGGNYLFDKVYINRLDEKLCIKHNSKKWRQNNILSAINLNLIDQTFDQETYLSKDAGNLIFLEENQVLNLGNITVTTINMEGHTIGSVGFLINEDRILVTSDATCPFVWLFLEESTTVSTYVNMLERVLLLPFDNFLVGHGQGKLLPKNRMLDFLKTAQSIDLTKSVKVTFNNFENLNSYCYTKGKMYDQNDSGIVFDPNKM